MNKKEMIEAFHGYVWEPEDYTEHLWFEQDGEVCWNTEGNVDHLFNQNGNTYIGEVKGDMITLDNLVLVNLDDGCGGMYQAFFNLNCKVEEE